jgi:hypothetical protein
MLITGPLSGAPAPPFWSAIHADSNSQTIQDKKPGRRSTAKTLLPPSTDGTVLRGYRLCIVHRIQFLTQAQRRQPRGSSPTRITPAESRGHSRPAPPMGVRAPMLFCSLEQQPAHRSNEIEPCSCLCSAPASWLHAAKTTQAATAVIPVLPVASYVALDQRTLS